FISPVCSTPSQSWRAVTVFGPIFPSTSRVPATWRSGVACEPADGAGCSAGSESCSGAGSDCCASGSSCSVSLVKPFSSQLSAMPSPSQLQSPWGSLLSRSVERFDCCSGSRASRDWSPSEEEPPSEELPSEELPSSGAGALPVSAPPLSAVPQVGHAPAPCEARTFSATAICWLLEAWSAVAAYSVPPKPSHVCWENCRPP